MFGAGRFFNAIRVIQQHAQIANTPDAGLRTDGWLAGLNAWVAEDAFLRLSAFPVEVDFLVRATADAHAPATAFVLVNQHNAVFFTLVDGTARAGGHAARVQAVFTQARQVHHEGVFKLAVHLLLDLVEVAVAGAFFELAAKQFFPVRAANNFVHPFAANQRARAGRREVIALWCTVQILVIKREGLVVIINAGQGRVGKDF